MNRKVWALTVTFAIVVSIFGMWQATQELPGEPSLWCVCASIEVALGPFGDIGLWQSMHNASAGFLSWA